MSGIESLLVLFRVGVNIKKIYRNFSKENKIC